jgi:hypothetical protein
MFVAVKLPLLMLGTTCIVMLLNWMVAAAMGSGLSFGQVMAITFGAMAVACWILLSLAPVAFLFMVTSTSHEAPTPLNSDRLRLEHNCLLLTHIALIALAGVAGNAALIQGLRQLVAKRCSLWRLYVCWIAAYAFVGCQLSWILRPFIGSPFFPVAFMRPDALERNFYEFVFTEVLPYVLGG